MKSLVMIFDVSELNDEQLGHLEMEAAVQAEESEGHPDVSVTTKLIDMTPTQVLRSLPTDEAVAASQPCVFCELGLDGSEHIASNRAMYAVFANAPQASFHVLVIPRKHVETLREADDDTLRAAHAMVKRLTSELPGYRLVVNVGEAGKQKIPHLHFHVLAGPEVLEDGFTSRVM